MEQILEKSRMLLPSPMLMKKLFATTIKVPGQTEEQVKQFRTTIAETGRIKVNEFHCYLHLRQYRIKSG